MIQFIGLVNTEDSGLDKIFGDSIPFLGMATHNGFEYVGPITGNKNHLLVHVLTGTSSIIHVQIMSYRNACIKEYNRLKEINPEEPDVVKWGLSDGTYIEFKTMFEDLRKEVDKALSKDSANGENPNNAV